MKALEEVVVNAARTAVTTAKTHIESVLYSSALVNVKELQPKVEAANAQLCSALHWLEALLAGDDHNN